MEPTNDLNEWAARRVAALLSQLAHRAASDLLRDAVRLTAAAERCRRWRA
jgi:hypothetical protein